MASPSAGTMVSIAANGRITRVHPKPDLDAIRMSAVAVVAFLLGFSVHRRKGKPWQCELCGTNSLDLDVFPEAAETTILLALAGDVAADIWLRQAPAFSPSSISIEEPSQSGYELLRAARQLGHHNWDSAYEALHHRFDALASKLSQPRLWVCIVVLASKMTKAGHLTSRMVEDSVRKTLLGDDDHAVSILSPALYADEAEQRSATFPVRPDTDAIAQMIAARLRESDPTAALTAAHEVERIRYSLGESKDTQIKDMRDSLLLIEDALRGPTPPADPNGSTP